MNGIFLPCGSNITSSYFIKFTMKDLENFTEDDLDIMHIIENNPKLSQRVISNRLGISLGKVNFCIQSLVEVGFIKLNNFSKSDNKIGYMYVLTPEGVSAKLKIAKKFLAYKQDEYEKLYNYIHGSEQ